MCKAAELGSIGILEDLLKYGCDINSKSIDGATALHIAVAAENVEITRFLIEQGARIDMYDTKASTPYVLDI
ncbi:hypothetical protein KP509_37G041100 [Ceratopteris richardii]|nr:hypothetical protein KP509_37G041100 [Ceratopteris richardii]